MAKKLRLKVHSHDHLYRSSTQRAIRRHAAPNKRAMCIEVFYTRVGPTFNTRLSLPSRDRGKDGCGVTGCPRNWGKVRSSARGGVEAGRFLMPWPEIPLPRYLFLVFHPAASDAILFPERSPVKREEAVSQIAGVVRAREVKIWPYRL